jgi:hypothetical protein
MQLNKPYLLFLGASQSMTDCKTGLMQVPPRELWG